MNISRLIGPLLVTTLLAVSASAVEPDSVGTQIAPFTLDDQFGVPQTVDASTRVILFSRDMKGGKLLKGALPDVTAKTLADLGAVYVADISGMPGLVASMFAIPSMKKRLYPILLDRHGQATLRLSDVEDQATVIFLNDLVITRFVVADSPNAVREALGMEPLPNPKAESKKEPGSE